MMNVAQIADLVSPIAFSVSQETDVDISVEPRWVEYDVIAKTKDGKVIVWRTSEDETGEWKDKLRDRLYGLARLSHAKWRMFQENKLYGLEQIT